MAIAITERNEPAATTANQNTYATGAFTPTAGALLIAIGAFSGTVLTSPGLTDSRGWTWSLSDGDTQSTFALSHARIVAPAATSGTLTFDYTADQPTGAGMVVLELTGFDSTTPIRQSIFDSNSGAGTTPTWNSGSGLASTLADSALISAFYNTTSPAGVTEPAGWTLTANQNWSSPTSGFEVAYHATPGSVSSVAWASTSATAWRGYVIEVAAAASARDLRRIRVLSGARQRASRW